MLNVKSELHVDSSSVVERKVSMQRADSELNDPEDPKKKRTKEPPVKTCEELGEAESLSDREKQLIHRFRIYESCQKDIVHILTFWDRVQGILPNPTTEDGQRVGEEQTAERHAPSGKKIRKEREREKLEKLERERQEKERMEKMKNMEDEAEVSQGPQQDGHQVHEDDEKALRIEVGIPYYELQVTGSQEPMERHILQSGWLPSVEEVSGTEAGSPVNTSLQ